MSASTVIDLHDVAVRGARGPVFGPLTARSDRPITVVLGPRGSGRTSLLLCIAGRMKPAEGSLAVLDETALAAIRRRTGIAGFEEIDALEPAVTLGATLRERLAWALPWYRRTPRMTPALTRDLLDDAFGDIAQPGPDAVVRDLAPAEEMLARIALALIEGPDMLVVDDFDAIRDPDERALVAGRLVDLAGRGIPVALATSDRGDLGLLAAASAGTAVGAPALIEL